MIIKQNCVIRKSGRNFNTRLLLEVNFNTNIGVKGVTMPFREVVFVLTAFCILSCAIPFQHSYWQWLSSTNRVSFLLELKLSSSSKIGDRFIIRICDKTHFRAKNQFLKSPLSGLISVQFCPIVYDAVLRCALLVWISDAFSSLEQRFTEVNRSR